MKHLPKLALALVLLAFSALPARAQSTNILLTIRVLDGSGTNTYTLNASANHVLGAVVAYNSWQAADPVNNTAAFPAFVRQHITDRIASLAELGNQYTSQSNRLYTISQQLPGLFPQMSPTDQAAFVQLFRKYSP